LRIELEHFIQVEWDLELLYAKLRGAAGFPSDVATTSPIALPENKTIQFPLQLYEKAYYRKIYDAASMDFLAANPTGEIHVASLIDSCHNIMFACSAGMLAVHDVCAQCMFFSQILSVDSPDESERQ